LPCIYIAGVLIRSCIGAARRLDVGAPNGTHRRRVCVCHCPQVSSVFALCFGDMTAKTVGWTIGITLLCVVVLSAVATVLLGIADWAVGVFLPD
jgi:hypothetical protein